MKKPITFVILLLSVSLSFLHAVNNREPEATTHSYTLDIDECLQHESDMFNKLSDIKGVEVVYISKDLLSMVPQKDIQGVSIGKMIDKIEEVQVFKAKDNRAVKSLKKEVNKLIKKGKYKTAMLVKNEGSRTGLYSKSIGGDVSDTFMVAEEGNGILLIRFIGRFTMEDIQNWRINSLDVGYPMTGDLTPTLTNKRNSACASLHTSACNRESRG